VSTLAARDHPYERLADFCRALLGALDASEGRRRRRKRDTTPDALGLGVKRSLLERMVARDPDPDDLDAWLLAQCLQPSGPHGAGAVRAMALEILDEWRLCRTLPAFGDWLARGAPSDDRIADSTSGRDPSANGGVS
jgi:hypothetical protein